MNTLTLHQPYASLVAIGVKTIIDTSWRPPESAVGERLLIHAAKEFRHQPYDKGFMERYAEWRALGEAGGMKDGLPLGAIVASCTVSGSVPIGHLPSGLMFGSERYPILSAPGYEADFEGRVWRGDHLMPEHPGNRGYNTLHLSLGVSKMKTYPVHKVVAEAWLGPRPDGLEVRHYDGDATNNAPWNLRYGTSAENKRDAAAHGRTTGANNHNTKLTDDDLDLIRKQRDQGWTQQAIADYHGVSRGHVSMFLLDRKRTTPEPVDDSVARSRWALLLSDVKATSDRCPNDCRIVTLDGENEGVDDTFTRVCTSSTPLGHGTLEQWDTCPTCDGAGSCPPIPATGRSRLWQWTP